MLTQPVHSMIGYFPDDDDDGVKLCTESQYSVKRHFEVSAIWNWKLDGGRQNEAKFVTLMKVGSTIWEC